ncbi:DgyrCDS7592 [Dimorphilus gyrociliatus]|uniref:DgyrCDS7592 n=1 Tax=Dimorphilus gyrociliatus TaxID=2664684 RepID=A0A7I8VRG5_9ANNE|nr:DgyrCDS7592 [Dimorphilus gyrociliatus]
MSEKRSTSVAKKHSVSQKIKRKKHETDAFREEDIIKESLAFKVLSEEITKECLECSDVLKIEEKLLDFLKLQQTHIDLKEGSALDYYVGLVWFAKQQKYNAEQTSALYTVGHNLFDNIQEKHISLVENLKELKKYFAGIAMNDTVELSGGLECFDLNQAKDILTFLNITIFQHYRLYEYMFCCTQAEEIIGLDLEVEVPKPATLPWPAPLDEAVDESLFKQYIAPPPEPTPEPELSEEELAALKAAEIEKDIETAKREDELLSQLQPEEIKKIISEVFEEVVGTVDHQVAEKLREKENQFIQRINKIHKVL